MNPALMKLASVVPSDSGGARAKNRFDFQRDWILCRILELYRSGQDFIVVCDYHDDVLVLNADPACATVDFFQVKTDAANRFTLASLLKRKKLKTGPGPSIIGKLYSHRFRFKGTVGRTTLVTNLHPKLTTANPPRLEDRTRWTVLDLAMGEQDSIERKLTDELATQGAVTLDESLAFETTPLPVGGHETFAVGVLTEFLHDHDGQQEHPVMALYRAVVDEIDRRSGKEGAFSSSGDIVAHKCITRNLFEEVLRRCLATSRRGLTDRVEQLVREDLGRAGMGVRRTQQVCRAVRRLALGRIDPGNMRLARLGEEARKFLDDPGTPDFGTLHEAMLAGVTALRALTEAQGMGDVDLMAVVAWELMDDREPATPTSKHEDEAS